jgi:hypothetical protein
MAAQPDELMTRDPMALAACEVCGNTYDKSMEVTVPSADGLPHTFDCFECAIEALAPRCGHCACRIIGHGVEARNAFFCCAHCARESGAGAELADRAG